MKNDKVRLVKETSIKDIQKLWEKYPDAYKIIKTTTNKTLIFWTKNQYICWKGGNWGDYGEEVL